MRIRMMAIGRKRESGGRADGGLREAGQQETK